MRKILCLLMIALPILLCAKVEVVSSADNTITLHVTTQNWQMQDTGTWSVLDCPDWNSGGLSGAPSLPEHTYYIGLPPDGQTSIATIPVSLTAVEYKHPLKPVSTPVKAGADSVDRQLYLVNSKLYAQPAGLTQAGEPMVYRNYRMLPLTLRPVEWDGQKLTVVTDYMVRITITGNTGFKGRGVDDPTVSGTVLNWEQARNWRIQPQRDNTNYAPFGSSAWWVKITVSSNGMYALDHSSLSSLPLADIDPRTFRIFGTGGEMISSTSTNSTYIRGLPFTEIPILVEGGEDGSFDNGDRIIFYGRNRFGNELNSSAAGGLITLPVTMYENPYSDEGVYWLTYGGDFPNTVKRMSYQNQSVTPVQTRQSQPCTVHNEKENMVVDEESFAWYYAELQASSTPYRFSVQCPGAVTDATADGWFDPTLQIGYRTVSGNSGNLHMSMNNVALNDTSYSSVYNYVVSRNFTRLISGTNTLTLSTTRPLYFDYFEVTYPRLLSKQNGAYEVNLYSEDAGRAVDYQFSGTRPGYIFAITNWNNAARLNSTAQRDGFDFIAQNPDGTKYYLVGQSEFLQPDAIERTTVTDLTTETRQVDDIVVYPQALAEPAQELAALHKARGFVTKLVDIQDVYNQFSGGMPDPHALRLFLKYAFNNYPGNRLTYVTLYGTGTIDFKNRSGNSALKNKLMVFLSGSTNSSVSDDFYGYFTQMSKPELAIGRIPAKTVSQGTFYNRRVEKYINTMPVGEWRDKMLILADDQYNSGAIDEHDHTVQMEHTAPDITKAMLVERIMSLEYDLDEYRNKPQVRSLMMDRINDGVLVWYYIGHGSYSLLGEEDYLRAPADLALFNNNDHLPLFIAASCSVGRYQEGSFDSMAELLLFLNNGGAVASIAATSECFGDGNTSLIDEYVKFGLNQRQNVGVGLMMAKPASYTSNNRLYNLLGDPTLPIYPPQFSSTVNFAGNSDSLRIMQKAQFTAQAAQSLDGSGVVRVFDQHAYGIYNITTATGGTYKVHYQKPDNCLFKGKIDMEGGRAGGSFFIPQDTAGGDSCRVLLYASNAADRTDRVVYRHPFKISGRDNSITDSTPPQVSIYLDDRSFISGDKVSRSPMLIADLSDENGINVVGKAGHRIVLNIDGDPETTDLTEYFVYSTGSSTTGTLEKQIEGLSAGHHTAYLIAYDNFNNPSMVSVDFTCSEQTGLSIKDVLPYPSPMEKDCWFTFRLTEAAAVSIDVYTITGRRIATLKQSCASGWNKVYWSGRDDDGDRPANGNYFYKVKAHGDSKTVEERGKLVIFR